MAERLRVAAVAVVTALVLTGCAANDPAAAPADTGAEAEAAPAAGDRLPDVVVEHFDGHTVALTGYVGAPLVINFWASWCPPCIAEMPDLEAVHQLADDQVILVGINTQDTPDRAAALVDQTGVTYELLRDPDGELFEAFGVFGMPSTFYVDADGTIVGRHTGLLTRDALLDDLDEQLGVDLRSP